MKGRVLLASMLLAAAPAPGTAQAQEPAMQDVAAHLARIDDALRRTAERAEAAREEKDIAKLVCVDGKLAAMRSFAKVAQQAHAELLACLVQNDAPGASISATKIAIARAKVETIRGQAEGCLGMLLYRVDEATSVEVQEPAGLPGGSEAGKGLGVARRLRPPEESSPLLGADPPARPGRPPGR